MGGWLARPPALNSPRPCHRLQTRAAHPTAQLRSKHRDPSQRRTPWARVHLDKCAMCIVTELHRMERHQHLVPLQQAAARGLRISPTGRLFQALQNCHLYTLGKVASLIPTELPVHTHSPPHSPPPHPPPPTCMASA